MMWEIIWAVCIAGGVGGIINALMTDNGFALPKSMQLDSGVSVLRPGFLGNILIGAAAAVVSWGLYGPLAAYVVLGSEKSMASNSPDTICISLSSLVGAVLIGVGGAKWLTGEVDNKILKATASKAAAAQPASVDAAVRMAMATPVNAFNIASDLAK